MSSTGEHAEINEDAHRGTGGKEYSAHHPVPNIQRYEQRQEERKQANQETHGSPGSPDSVDEYGKRDKIKKFLHLGNLSRSSSISRSLYGSRNRNRDSFISTHSRAGSEAPTESHGAEVVPKHEQETKDGTNDTTSPEFSTTNGHGKASEQSAASQGSSADAVVELRDNPGKELDGNENKGPEAANELEDTSEVAGDPGVDARQKRKAMKNRNTGGDRLVTDPVTHLQTSVHDYTQKELDLAPASLDIRRSGTGLSEKERSESELDDETEENLKGDRATRHLFPPPSIYTLEKELTTRYGIALSIGINMLWIVLVLAFGIGCVLNGWPAQRTASSLAVWSAVLAFCAVGTYAINYLMTGWLKSKISRAFEDHVWEESLKQEHKERSAAPESVMWLNSLLSSIWPLINPDLFTSLADTLEDVMQASLNPKLVRMVAVDDIGQGSLAPRILGARWLPEGAAGQTVSKDGGRISGKGKKGNDRKVQGEGQVADTKDEDNTDSGDEIDPQKQQSDDQDLNEGLEAESGDFVNLELVFSYRATPKGKGLKDRSKTAHLYLVFYLPGNIPIPVYVSLRGIVGKMRLRMQLAPDPPFVNLCTVTLLGQPKADLSCIPITKKFLNLMDLPLISQFVQSSIDAALSEYVAPRSLTLDLKQMLEGDDFKKNTGARGVIVVEINRAYGIKEADSGVIGMKEGSSDCYVSVGWAKFGKAVWSSRVILKEMKPVWQERAYILVGPEEVNAEESLRVQLWDSDRLSADDDLGRIEISLSDLMKQAKGKMIDRTDGFIAMDADEKMPGTLDWRFGWYEKVQLTHDQFKAQTVRPEIRNMQQLKDEVAKNAGRKLREANRDVSDEEDQQKAQDFEDEANELICAAPPPKDYPSGILSIQIHNITGLQLASLNKDRGSEGGDVDEDFDNSDDLPSSYATVILNGKSIFKTRTKPKNSNPFFNASTERFIRNWQNTEVMVSVRDDRTHEDDPLLGFVYLPLEQVFHSRGQISQTYPLSGGAGYGKIRISMVFRAVDLQLPRELQGWDYGTVEVAGAITSKDLPSDLSKLRMKIRTSHGKGKLYSSDVGRWTSKKERKIHLAVSSRYSSTLVIELRKNQALIKDKTPAFAILWLKDIPDDEKTTVTIPVWGGDSDLDRAKANCLEECGDKIGTLTVPLQFYSGLSEYHHHLAKKHPDVGAVMEVQDAACDQKEKEDDIPSDGGGAGSSSSSSSDSDSDSDSDGELAEDGKRNPIKDVKEYKKDAKTLHRRQRGLMQWKVARTANWVKGRAERGAEKVRDGAFSHHERDTGIETEV